MTTSEIKKLLSEHRNIEFKIDMQTLIQRKDSMLGSNLTIKHAYADWKWEQGTLDEMVKKFVPRIKYYQKKYDKMDLKVTIKDQDHYVIDTYTI